MAQTLFNKDIIEMLALFLLQKEDMYGYQIMKSIRSYSEDLLSLQGGSLYPIFFKLVEKGLVSERVEHDGKRQRSYRVYYHLTPLGKERLRDLIDAHARMEKGIQNIFRNAKEGDGE